MCLLPIAETAQPSFLCCTISLTAGGLLAEGVLCYVGTWWQGNDLRIHSAFLQALEPA